MPPGYYTLTAPALLRQDRHALSPLRRAELDKFGAACRTRPELRGVVQTLFDVMLPRGKAESGADQTLAALLEQHGFDRVQHEQIRTDLKEGRIGLAQNRLPASAVIEDVQEGDVVVATAWLMRRIASSGAGVPPVSPGVSPALPPSSKDPQGRDALATGGTPAPLPALPFMGFEKDQPASISSRRLPHWRQEGVTYFVTFRLKDALPRAAVQRLQTERENWLRLHPEPHTTAQLDQLHELCFDKLDQELDQGYGACVLKEAAVAEIVESALHHFDEERYWLGTPACSRHSARLPTRTGNWRWSTLAAGAGSRWTQGAGVVKALHPFCKLGGPPSHLHGDAPGQEPARLAPGRHAHPAHLHHQLPDPRADRGVPRPAKPLRLRRARCSSRPANRSACA